jgi:dipeptidyl aminopeptidase/acylaminoacyl peptidase
MPNDTHDDIRQLLFDAAADLPVLAPAPEQTLRRARRRMAVTFSTIAVVVGLAIGGIVTAAGPFTRSVPADEDPERGGIWIVDTDTAAATRLAGLPRQAFWFDASRGGSTIAFAAQWHGSSQIYVMARDGSGRHVVTHDRYEASQPALSPDGTRVAYRGFGHGDGRNVFVVEPDGRVRQLTHERRDVSSLAWSADGSSILYSVVVPNPPNPGTPPIFGFNGESIKIKEVNVTTGEIVPLVGGRRAGANFGTWSPDGRRIAYLSGEWLSGSYGFASAQIWIEDADGSDRHRLAPLDGEVVSLEWAPHANLMAYSVAEGDWFATYVIDATSGQTRRVTTGGFPVWLDDHTLIVQR